MHVLCLLICESVRYIMQLYEPFTSWPSKNLKGLRLENSPGGSALCVSAHLKNLFCLFSVELYLTFTQYTSRFTQPDIFFITFGEVANCVFLFLLFCLHQIFNLYTQTHTHTHTC